ncbi:MAG TPA: bifunctional 4-hydroxy-2-oxoglutarate aldolase/2-dehydro-3-deoxy-phosphogluconate aldolase [Chitinophaga sp.]|uniref:bifunctional 4-hydroxy-2-oxoglutarate aldolase/2-dehydro-3-deoxy-phosphogluconate aldolase n=1 Tax=Chitinophaga sp. TaxID=1869181 RepID=UPI002DC04DDB|nr:bifunctional 4-hydroxy-2-oxoglutarate aldolase/2-dehydro-3-deoxy-phosphogluconate aldolase [Chitinophaga sp.]HEU4552416.1 bifunctional 4-hydroxy-2-oxoglutarate aldolase/2-dehydro-3-deoxy-phosphogluconate aldolase [Chitinophaga sp.]
MPHAFSQTLFDKLPIVGILRNMPPLTVPVLARYYQAAGLTTLEVTLNSEEALTTITRLVQEFEGQLNIGAGTVCTLNDLEKALGAGAQFIVTPILQEEVVRACQKAQVPVFPGAYSPTEIYTAWHLGATMVKVFPATKLGASYFKEVLAPMDYLRLMPTGGVTPDNFTEFLAAGAKGLGMGSHLFPKTLIEEGQWEELAAHFKRVVEKYKTYRNNLKTK